MSTTQRFIHYGIGLLMLFAAAYVISIAWKAGQKGISFKPTGESGYKKLRCEKDDTFGTGECVNLTNNQPVHCYRCGSIRG